MINKMKSVFPLFLIGLLFMSLFCIPAISGQESSDDALKKKYAPICGEYEFDLSEYGGEVQLLSFLIREGEIWVDSGDGDPGIMKPVEGSEFEFKAVSSDGQEFEISFLKDDQGEYSLCKIIIVAMGLDITGNKIK